MARGLRTRRLSVGEANIHCVSTIVIQSGARNDGSVSSGLCASAASGDLGADHLGGGAHGFEFAEGDVARKIFHAAVGGDDETIGWNHFERGADTRGNDLRSLDGVVA